MSLALSWRRLAHESQGQVPEGTQPEQGRHKKLVGTGRCFFVATGPYFTLCTVQSSEPGHATFRRGHDRMDSAARGRYFQPCEMFPAGHRHTHGHTHTHTLGVSLTDEHKRCACIGPAGRDPFFKPSAIAMNSNVSQQSCRCLPARLFCPCIQFR